ncbi:aspartyl-tRNA synthetase [Lineolata rhizophorae]|uniref:aspartate--tRNA ligase n=1 Tax=Lineolata rhizophorae TaxID=578093 RepID=A0A6A6P9X1_9PEZI|nr:aspartyl-tRNA synthetase [Lineolata rhizophorae]
MSSEQPKAEQSLPERPKEGGDASAPPAEGEAAAAPSKNALKKAAKEKEKAEKAARRAAAEAQQKTAAAASDVSADRYGDLPMVGSVPYAGPSGETRIKLADLASAYPADGDAPPADTTVVFRAVVETARVQSAKLAFVSLRQGLDNIQGVVAASDEGGISRQMVKWCGGVSPESMVLVHGGVARPKEPVKSASVQHLEIHIGKLFVISKAEVPLPLQIEDAERPLPGEGKDAADEAQEAAAGRPIVGLNTRLNNRVLDLRGKHNHAIFTIKEGVCALFTEFLRARGFVGIQTPKMMGAATEGGSNVFEVTYFERKAYMAQSPQLHKQMLVASRFERVFEIGPIFRAENSNTARHLTEFTGLDLEMAFEEDYHEVVKLIEDLMLYMFKGLRERYKKETDLVRSLYHVDEFQLPEEGKVPRIPFKEGIHMLREDGADVGDYDDLSTPDEKRLGALVLKKYHTDFYVLDQFPLGVRPFYTMPSPADPHASNSYDFFMRGQEIMSGAQRVHDARFLVRRMRAMDPPLDPDQPGLKDYVDAFRYGCPPHAGGGLGLERIVMLWLGLPNIRLACLFPRDPQRLMP